MRTLAPIAVFVVLLVLTFSQPATAFEPASGNESAPTVTDDFCGKTPPASVISCPQTGLDSCRCYLSDEHDSSAPPVVEAPKRSTSTSTPRPLLVTVLPDFEEPQAPSSQPQLSLERPPR